MTSVRRTAIVTGAGVRDRAGHRPALAKEGHAVAVLDLDEAAAEMVVGELRRKGHEALAPGSVDASSRAQVDDAMRRIRGAVGPV